MSEPTATDRERATAICLAAEGESLAAMRALLLDDDASLAYTALMEAVRGGIAQALATVRGEDRARAWREAAQLVERSRDHESSDAIKAWTECLAAALRERARQEGEG